MEGWPVGYLQGMEELNSGPPKTNPSSGREEDLNPGPPDYKSSTLPLGHARLYKVIKCIISLRLTVSLLHFRLVNLWSATGTVRQMREIFQTANQEDRTVLLDSQLCHIHVKFLWQVSGSRWHWTGFFTYKNDTPIIYLFYNLMIAIV